MGTGNDGLRRIVEAGMIPAWLIQKYLESGFPAPTICRNRQFVICALGLCLGN